MIITLTHLNTANFCRKGTRKWFRAHNLSYADFRKNGIDSEILIKLNDPMGLKLVEIVNGR